MNYTVELKDGANGALFKASMTYEELQDYFTKREFLANPNTTITHHLDGNITIDAWDKKKHHIFGTAKKCQPDHANTRKASHTIAS